MTKLIIIDRDGVINEDSDDYIRSPDEWLPIPGSLEAISRLNRAGYIVAVATNQSGLARGYFDTTDLSAMHRKMELLLQEHGGHIDAIFYCPHGPDDGCSCRKPKPGLLKEIGKRFQARMEDVYFIGDTVSDLKAAVAANVKPLLVKTGKGEKTQQKLKGNGFSKVPVYENLYAAVEAVLDDSKQA